MRYYVMCIDQRATRGLMQEPSAGFSELVNIDDTIYVTTIHTEGCGGSSIDSITNISTLS